MEGSIFISEGTNLITQTKNSSHKMSSLIMRGVGPLFSRDKIRLSRAALHLRQYQIDSIPPLDRFSIYQPVWDFLIARTKLDLIPATSPSHQKTRRYSNQLFLTRLCKGLICPTGPFSTLEHQNPSHDVLEALKF